MPTEMTIEQEKWTDRYAMWLMDNCHFSTKLSFEKADEAWAALSKSERTYVKPEQCAQDDHCYG